MQSEVVNSVCLSWYTIGMDGSNITEILISAPHCGTACALRNDDCEFQVRWEINPHMKIGAVDAELARKQHRNFRSVLQSTGASIIELPFLHGVFDSVFTKDSAILSYNQDSKRVLLTKPSTVVRRAEQPFRKLQLRNFGFEEIAEAEETLEGGDVLFVPNRAKIFFGYGIRSSFQATSDLRNFTGYEVVPLELVDPYFFHLDTALNFVSVGDRAIAFAYREAFSNLAWEYLVNDDDVATVIEVSRAEALMFGLNWIEANGTIILGSQPPFIMKLLNSLGKKIEIVPLDQFQLAGGSAACLATRVHKLQSLGVHRSAKVEVQGWINSLGLDQ